MSAPPVESVICSKCGSAPKKKKFRKDGQAALPFRWVRIEGEAVCMKCREPVDTCNYSFDCKIIAGHDLVNDQMWKAHKYRNALCEVERGRRDKANDILRTMWPDLVDLETKLESLETEIEKIRTAIKSSRKESRKNLRGTTDQNASLKSLRDERKILSKRRTELRQEAFSDPKTKFVLEASENWANAEIKRVRAESGLYWGTYSMVDSSANRFRTGPPPKFRRYEGARIGVQLQKGEPIANLWESDDTRLRLSRTESRNTNGPLVHALVRIWSNDNGSPEWCKVAFRLHRPFPAGAMVKWAFLVRRRCGTHNQDKIVFSLTFAGAGKKIDQATEGKVGINTGWRTVADGLRVAFWVGSDGKLDHLVLPQSIVDRYSKAEALRSQQATNFNGAVKTLAGWLASMPAGGPDSPGHWLRESTATLDQWRSERRLSSLVIKWRTNRIPGDDAIFVAMEAWRKQDRHLYDWWTANQAKAARQRLELYRRFAAKLRRLYRAGGIMNINWREAFMKKKPVEQDVKDKASRFYFRIASPGLLHQELTSSFAATVLLVPSNITQTCHHCHGMDAFDAASNLIRTCRHCGTTEDQDFRAASNLLSRMNSEPAAGVTKELSSTPAGGLRLSP